MPIINTTIENQDVKVYFDFTSYGEIDWDGLVVEALLPQRTGEQSVNVIVNDLLSDADTKKIEDKIYEDWVHLTLDIDRIDYIESEV